VNLKWSVLVCLEFARHITIQFRIILRHFHYPILKYFLLAAISAAGCCFKRNQPWNTQWINKVSFDIWRWCHTPFQSYRPQLCNGSDHICFKFHFLVRRIEPSVQLKIAKRKLRFREERKKLRNNFYGLSPTP
jgi:hypothetical protein